MVAEMATTSKHFKLQRLNKLCMLELHQKRAQNHISHVSSGPLFPLGHVWTFRASVVNVVNLDWSCRCSTPPYL